jgi:1,4-alpha-glucan branching enzyme
MVLPSGERIERLPAWITRVTQDLSVSPVYDARFWNPPKEEIYKFKHQRPQPSKSLRIYEAHVGISTSENRVGTYKEFTQNILPRIKKLGYNTIQLMAIMEHAYYACLYTSIFLNFSCFHTPFSFWVPGYQFFRRQLSLWYTRGTEGANRYCARFGNLSAP